MGMLGILDKLGSLFTLDTRGKGSQWRENKTGRWANQPMVFQHILSATFYCGYKKRKFEIVTYTDEDDEIDEEMFPLLQDEVSDECSRNTSKKEHDGEDYGYSIHERPLSKRMAIEDVPFWPEYLVLG